MGMSATVRRGGLPEPAASDGARSERATPNAKMSTAAMDKYRIEHKF